MHEAKSSPLPAFEHEGYQMPRRLALSSAFKYACVSNLWRGIAVVMAGQAHAGLMLQMGAGTVVAVFIVGVLPLHV